MKPSSLRARKVTAVLAAAVSVGAASACSATSPAETMHTMDPSDGVPVDLGPVQVRNLALVSAGAGKAATVTGVVENSSSEDATVTMAAAGGKEVEASVPARSLVVLSEDGDPITFDALEQGPGEVLPMSVAVDGSDSTPANVPVLAPTGYYEEYAPEGWTPTPTESESHDEEHGDEEH